MSKRLEMRSKVYANLFHLVKTKRFHPGNAIISAILFICYSSEFAAAETGAGLASGMIMLFGAGMLLSSSSRASASRSSSSAIKSSLSASAWSMKKSCLSLTRSYCS